MADQSVQNIEGRSVVPISTRDRNESQGERIACGAVGGLLLIVGLRKGGLKGLVEIAAGAWLVREALTGHSLAYQLLGVDHAEPDAPASEGASDDAKEFTQSITVGLPLEEAYRKWRDPAIFAQSMAHFAVVSASDPDRAHWEVRTPVGRAFAWDARVVEEEPSRLTRWTTEPGADIPNEASVAFREAPAGRGTEIHYTVRMDPPGGLLGDKLFDLAQALPKAMIAQGLRRFKSFVETGEMPTLDPQPHGRTLLGRTFLGREPQGSLR